MKTRLLTALADVPCDYAELRYQETTTTAITCDRDGVKDVSIAVARGCFCRVLCDGHFGTSSFEDVERHREYVDKAIAAARVRRGEFRGFSPLPPIRDDVVTAVGRAPDDVSLEEKVELVTNYNRILLQDKRIPSTATQYVDACDYRVYVNSEGTAVSVRQPRFGLSLRPIANDGTTVQMAIYNIGGVVGFEHLTGREAEVERLVVHAASLLDAEPVTGGTYDVITDPVLTGLFAHEAFGHTAEADEIAQDENLRAIMARGKRFGSEVLTLVDDGTYRGHFGYTPYDDEGVPGQKTPLIREGILVGLLHNRETATRMGVAPTGNARAMDYRVPPLVRMTSTYIAGGETSFEEMLARLGDGIYARRAKGGTGGETFSFTAEDGFLVEKGKITKHLRDLKLQGNLFQTLANIEAVGDDFMMPDEGCGGCGKGGQFPLPVASGGPHMLIRKVQVGGR